MGAAIPLRGDFDAASVRRLAQQSRAGAQSRGLLAVAAIYDGHRRSDAARFAGVGLQIVRDWVCASTRTARTVCWTARQRVRRTS